MTWKRTIVTLLIFTIMFGFGSELAFAAPNNSLINKIVESGQQGEGLSELENTIDEAGAGFVRFLRRIAIVIAILVICWIAFTMLGSDERKLTDMKGRVLLFFIALFIVFFAEQILALFFSITGIDISRL